MTPQPDLSAANATRLREKPAKYVDNGKRVTQLRNTKAIRQATKSIPVSRDQTQATRE